MYKLHYNGDNSDDNTYHDKYLKEVADVQLSQRKNHTRYNINDSEYYKK